MRSLCPGHLSLSLGLLRIIFSRSLKRVSLYVVFYEGGTRYEKGRNYSRNIYSVLRGLADFWALPLPQTIRLALVV